jgi:hypothetical protein
MLMNAEKEKLVIDLYYNERKNVLQTAQEARISFRDIAAIIKKKEAAAVNDDNGSGNGIVAMDNQQRQQLGNGSSQCNQKSTRAYKLFSGGYKPAIITPTFIPWRSIPCEPMFKHVKKSSVQKYASKVRQMIRTYYEEVE